MTEGGGGTTVIITIGGLEPDPKTVVVPGIGPVTTEVIALLRVDDFATVTITTGGLLPEAGMVVVPATGPTVVDGTTVMTVVGGLMLGTQEESALGHRLGTREPGITVVPAIGPMEYCVWCLTSVSHHSCRIGKSSLLD